MTAKTGFSFNGKVYKKGAKVSLTDEETIKYLTRRNLINVTTEPAETADVEAAPEPTTEKVKLTQPVKEKKEIKKP